MADKISKLTWAELVKLERSIIPLLKEIWISEEDRVAFSEHYALSETVRKDPLYMDLSGVALRVNKWLPTGLAGYLFTNGELKLGTWR